MFDLHLILCQSACLPETLGRPQRGRRIAILSSGTQGELAEFGETGLIAVDRRDPGLMLGYLGKDYEHKYQGDWFLTGDLGQMYRMDLFVIWDGMMML